MVSKNDDSLEKVSNDNQPGLIAALPTPRLFEAVDRDDVGQLKQILTSHPDGWQDKDKYGSTLLHRAAGKGSKECLQYILEKCSEDVSTMDKKGCQPLHYAAYNGRAETVELLLNNKADINAKNKEGQIPLLAACLAGHVRTAKLLLEQHYKENPSELPPKDAAGNTLLHMSVIGTHVMVKELLESMRSLGYTTEQLKQLVGSANKARQTILHIAAMRCQLPTIQEYLSQLQLSVDASVEDKHQKTCGYYAQKCQKEPSVMNQNKDTVQPKYRQKGPNTLMLESPRLGRNSSIDSTLSTMSTLSKVTPGTDGVNVLGEIVKQLIIKKLILNKDHKVEVHVFTPKELPSEDSSLAVNRATDSNLKLELLGGLHGHILNKLPPDCHLVAPIVMVKLGASKPLMMKVTIPHALTTTIKPSNSEIKLFAISTFGVPGALERRNYTLDEKNCIVTMVINKQQIFVLTVIGRLLTQSRSFLSVNPTYRPPAIKCIYYVLSEPSNHEISVKVYCGIDLPITWKLLSEIKKQPNEWGTFILSHEHIDISYHCVKNCTGWTISNSSHTVNALSILPSPQAEVFVYPPAWEFKVFPRPDVKYMSEKVTCELRIAAGKTKLASQRFHHDRPPSYYSKQSTPVSAADPLLGDHGNSHDKRLGERLELAIPVQCDTVNVDSMEHNGQASTTIHMQPMSNSLNSLSNSQEPPGESSV